jgi:hypothetical protein
VDSPIFRLLGDTFLLMPVNAAAEHPEPDEDNASNEVILYAAESNSHAWPHAPPSQKAVLLSLMPGHVCHLKW